MTVEEAIGPAVEVWPDNVLAVAVFVSMGTQWRCAGSGPYGLDYNVLPTVMRYVGVKAEDEQEVFDDLRVLEDAALGKMQEKR